jgi:dTDP-4-dehydrorhamnose 3,5-epimerase
MEIIESPFQDCFVLKPHVIEDDRGHFFESFNTKKFSDLTGLNVDFVQDNQSFSTYGVIRGLHAQEGKHAQAKLVRVLYGEVLDVVVDARPESSTYGKHFSILLNAENKLQLFIPRGFYHGFSVLSSEAVFFYKCDNFYNKDSERGTYYADPSLAIDWRVPKQAQLLTEKDINLPLFNHRK